MLIDVYIPETALNNAYIQIRNKCGEFGLLELETTRNGYIFCKGKLGYHTATTFAPVSDNEGMAYVVAEMLCMKELLSKYGFKVEFSKIKEVEIRKSATKPTSLTEQYITQSTSYKDALRRVSDSGYGDMEGLENAMQALREQGRRVNKHDLARYIFKEVAKQELGAPKKQLRSGLEWVRVKGMAERAVSLPKEYQSADEFATFAGKEEIDGLEYENN